MDYRKYDTEVNSDHTIYTFTSNGINGEILKAIRYSVTNNEEVYNLGFGDIVYLDEVTGALKIDDIVVTDNGDRDVVLATVAQSVYDFSEVYPERFILFRGSTPARTRLYRIAITRNYRELSETFHIFGAIVNDEGELTNVPFTSGIDFEAFFIKRRG